MQTGTYESYNGAKNSFDDLPWSVAIPPIPYVNNKSPDQLAHLNQTNPVFPGVDDLTCIAFAWNAWTSNSNGFLKMFFFFFFSGYALHFYTQGSFHEKYEIWVLENTSRSAYEHFI